MDDLSRAGRQAKFDKRLHFHASYDNHDVCIVVVVTGEPCLHVYRTVASAQHGMMSFGIGMKTNWLRQVANSRGSWKRKKNRNPHQLVLRIPFLSILKRNCHGIQKAWKLGRRIFRRNPKWSQWWSPRWPFQTTGYSPSVHSPIWWEQMGQLTTQWPKKSSDIA